MEKLDNDALVEVGEEIVKKPKGKPRGRNIFKDEEALSLNPGDNTKYLTYSLAIMDLEDIDLKNPEEVRERINWYFNHCAKSDMKPTVNGLALALGTDRRRLWEIKTGNLIGGVGQLHLPRETMDLIKKAYKIMEILWENYMQNGKINPVAGIFLGKNHFDYKDQSEYVLTPNTPTSDDPTTLMQAAGLLPDGTDK